MTVCLVRRQTKTRQTYTCLRAWVRAATSSKWYCLIELEVKEGELVMIPVSKGWSIEVVP